MWWDFHDFVEKVFSNRITAVIALVVLGIGLIAGFLEYRGTGSMTVTGYIQHLIDRVMGFLSP